MNYVIINNQNHLHSPTVSRQNYQFQQYQQSPRVVVSSRSPLVYKNSKVVENKIIIPTNSINHNIVPKINQTYINVPIQCISADQSPQNSKLILLSSSPTKLYPYPTSDRQLTPRTVIQNTPNVLQSNKKTDDSKKSTQEKFNSKQLSPNQTLNNTNNTQAYTASTPFTLPTTTNTYNTLPTDPNFRHQTQQQYYNQPQRNEDYNNQYQKGDDYLSSKASQFYRSSVQQGNDQDLLDIVSKYIGNKQNSSSFKSQVPQINHTQYQYSQFEEPYQEIEQVQQAQYNALSSQQYQNNIASTNFDSCSKANYSTVEETNRTHQYQSVQHPQQEEQLSSSVHTLNNQDKNTEEEKQQQQQLQEESSSSSKQQDEQSKQIYENAEIIKMHLNKMQEQMNFIKSSTFNFAYDLQSQYSPNVSEVQYTSPQVLANLQPLPFNQESANIVQQNNLFINNISNAQNKQEVQQPLDSQRNASKSAQDDDMVLQFTECSNNQTPQHADSAAADDDDKLNLAVYEEENQAFDFSSSDNLEEETIKHTERDEKERKSEIRQSSNSKSKIPQINQQLDPIQEEDFLSRSSIDTHTIRKQLSGSFSNVTSNTHINQENATNQAIQDKQHPSREIINSIDSDFSKGIHEMLNAKLSQPLDLDQEMINDNNKEEFMGLFNSNFDEIVCIGEKGSQDNLFSQDSYENILELYASGQSTNNKDIMSSPFQIQKNHKEYQKNQSDSANNSQQFITVSSIDAESLKRSNTNLASFSVPSPQRSLIGTEYAQLASATFNQDTSPSKQSTEFELIESQNDEQLSTLKSDQDPNQLRNKLITLSSTSVQSTYAGQRIEGSSTEQPASQNSMNTQGKQEQTKQKINLKEIAVIVVFIFLVMLIGCFFIFFIQDNSLARYISQNRQQNIVETQISFSNIPTIESHNITETVFPICEIENTIYTIVQCFQPLID